MLFVINSDNVPFQKLFTKHKTRNFWGIKNWNWRVIFVCIDFLKEYESIWL